MTDANDNNAKNTTDHGYSTSESDKIQNPQSSVITNQPKEHNDVNTFDSNMTENESSSIVTPHVDKPEGHPTTNTSADSGAHEEKTNSEIVNPVHTHEVSTSSHSHNEHEKENPTKTNSDESSDEFDRPNNPKISYGRREPDLVKSMLRNATNQKLLDRLLGCAYGQALGDAYGLSTEFEDRNSVAYSYPEVSELIPFPGYKLTGHNRRWTRGDWTDDTDQWILILDTLMEHDGDVTVFAKKLTHWIQNGYRELGDHGGMGLGANVSQVVRSHGYVENPLKISEGVWENGKRQAAPNGALMRCSASAFVHFKDIKKVILTTMSMCQTTHFDPRCVASCLAVCLTIAYILQEQFEANDTELQLDDEHIDSLIKRVQKKTIEIIGNRFTEVDQKLFLWFTDVRTLEELNLDEERAIGYTYKCLASGFYGLRSKESFERTLNDLIRYGGDADTNGAVCGTMFGVRYGYKKLPYKWLRAMPFKKWFDQKIIKHLEKMNLIQAGTKENNE